MAGPNSMLYLGFFFHAEIPVFPTITATVTLESYERKVTSPVPFLIPRDYKKVNVTRASLSECSSELTSTTNKPLMVTSHILTKSTTLPDIISSLF